MRSIAIVISLFFILTVFTNVPAQNRKVLVEQFTNSGCPPCASNTPAVAAYINAHSDSVLMLAYHTSFPYQDSMYHENPIQSNNRVSFYNVSGVPHSVVDGNYFSGNLVSGLATVLPTRAAAPPRFNINFISNTINNSQVAITVSFESLDVLNQNELLIGHVVLAEKKVLKSSYVCCAGANSESEYPWVMRRMLPDEYGTTLTNTQLGGVSIVTLTTLATNIKDFNELRIISFVQNSSTKEIYQSEISVPVSTTGITESDSDKNNFYFANPALTNTLTIQFQDEVVAGSISVTTLEGKLLLKEPLHNEAYKSINIEKVSGGIYFLTVVLNGTQVVKKLVIQ